MSYYNIFFLQSLADFGLMLLNNSITFTLLVGKIMFKKISWLKTACLLEIHSSCF